MRNSRRPRDSRAVSCGCAGVQFEGVAVVKRRTFVSALALALPGAMTLASARSALALSPAPQDQDLPAPAAEEPIPADLQAWLDAQERTLITRTLNDTGFNRTAAAARLGLNLRQMRYRMARLAIVAPSSGCDADDLA